MNNDQGSHFTSPKYTRLFQETGCLISMDHRGRAYDNIFIERFWRSLKYEDIYLKDYQYPREARKGYTSIWNTITMKGSIKALATVPRPAFIMVVNRFLSFQNFT